MLLISRTVYFKSVIGYIDYMVEHVQKVQLPTSKIQWHEHKQHLGLAEIKSTLVCEFTLEIEYTIDQVIHVTVDFKSVMQT